MTGQQIVDAVLLRLADADQNMASKDPTILGHINRALDEISREIAKWPSRRFGRSSTDLSYTSPAYQAALPSGFLCLALDEDKRPQVFDITSGVNRLPAAKQTDIDGWRAETSADTGLPGSFYLEESASARYLSIHPRPNVDSTVQIDYFAVHSISGLTEDIPWNGDLDQAVEEYVLMCEYEALEFTDLLRKALHDYTSALSSVITQRVLGHKKFRMKPARGQGWDAGRRSNPAFTVE